MSEFTHTEVSAPSLDEVLRANTLAELERREKSLLMREALCAMRAEQWDKEENKLQSVKDQFITMAASLMGDDVVMVDSSDLENALESMRSALSSVEDAQNSIADLSSQISNVESEAEDAVQELEDAISKLEDLM